MIFKLVKEWHCQIEYYWPPALNIIGVRRLTTSPIDPWPISFFIWPSIVRPPISHEKVSLSTLYRDGWTKTGALPEQHWLCFLRYFLFFFSSFADRIWIPLLWALGCWSLGRSERLWWTENWNLFIQWGWGQWPNYCGRDFLCDGEDGPETGGSDISTGTCWSFFYQ